MHLPALVGDFDASMRMVTACAVIRRASCGGCGTVACAESPFPEGASPGPVELGVVPALFATGCADARTAWFFRAVSGFGMAANAVAAARRAVAAPLADPILSMREAIRARPWARAGPCSGGATATGGASGWRMPTPRCGCCSPPPGPPPNTYKRSSRIQPMHKGIAAAILIAVALAVGVLIGPLFHATEVDEALPAELNRLREGLTMEEFSNMDDRPRAALVGAMPDRVKEMIMDEAAGSPTSVSEGMDESGGLRVIKTGSFVGLAGHHARGDAKILQAGDSQYLRFENFEVTNGPDLRVYVTRDGDVKQGIHLDKLKGSRGSQNYALDGIDTAAYGTVVIYCQPFGAYFGEATLS